LLHVSVISCRRQGIKVRRNVYNRLVEKKKLLVHWNRMEIDTFEEPAKVGLQARRLVCV
jgi:hypothetical protein